MMDFIVRVKYGGLGDHLFFSHIPRAAKFCGYGRVLVSNHNSYRDPAYKHLVWEMNPFVDGFTDEDAPCPEGFKLMDGENLLDATMLRRGVDDGVRYHEPELYYDPMPDKSLKDEVVFDPNFVGNAGDGIGFGEVEEFVERRGVTMVMPRRDKGFTVGAPEVETDGSLRRYCEVIRSCRRFVCLASGGATLAAALNMPAWVIYGPAVKGRFLHSGMHVYIPMGGAL